MEFKLKLRKNKRNGQLNFSIPKRKIPPLLKPKIKDGKIFKFEIDI